MRVLLDANAYSALMADRGSVADYALRADSVLISAVVLGELLFGFRNGARYKEQSSAALLRFSSGDEFRPAK